MRGQFTEFERMKFERQSSASLYAVNGVEELMGTLVNDPGEALWDLPPLCSLELHRSSEACSLTTLPNELGKS